MENPRESQRFISINLHIPPQKKQAFEQALLTENVRRMFILSIYTIALQVVMNTVSILVSQPNGGASASGVNVMLYYITLSLSLMVVGIIFAILLALALKGKITRRGALIFLTNGMLYLMLAGQVGFSVINALLSKSFYSYYISILIIGSFPILKPKKSILSILAVLACMITALFLYYPPQELRTFIAQTDVWTSFFIITILVGGLSVIIYGMFLSNFLKAAALQERNDELTNFNKRLEEAANTDAMTGAFNRRALSLFFTSLGDEAARTDRKLTVAIFDIDHFKEFNDTFGHIQGDDCLKKISQSLHGSFRRSQDLVYRYGGEEFLVIFETRADNSWELIEQARTEVETLQIPHAPNLGRKFVTVSAGYTVVEHVTQETVMRALNIADQALYDSKNSGRNRSTCGAFST